MDFLSFYLYSHMQQQSPIFAINDIALAKKLKDLTVDEFKELMREEFATNFKALKNNEAALIAASDDEGYINLKQAAEFLKYKESYIYKLINKGEIPHHKNGRRLLFKKSELAKWVASGGK